MQCNCPLQTQHNKIACVLCDEICRNRVTEVSLGGFLTSKERVIHIRTNVVIAWRLEAGG
jgi:hypothetical protein